MEKITDRFQQALLSMDRLEAQSILDNLAPQEDTMQYVEKLVVPVLERIGDLWEQGQLPLAQIYMRALCRCTCCDNISA